MLISSIETQSCFHVTLLSVPIFSTDLININGVKGTGINLKKTTKPKLIPKKKRINFLMNLNIFEIIMHKKRDVNILPFLFFCSFIFYQFYHKRYRCNNDDDNDDILYIMRKIKVITI